MAASEPLRRGAVPAFATAILRVAGGSTADAPALPGAGETLVGYVDRDGGIWRVRMAQPQQVGRCTPERQLLRATAHGERELGQVLESGAVMSVGLLEGGPVGWMEPDGVVIAGGGLIAEQEVGRVEGPLALQAAGAMLLLFLPDEREADSRAFRGA